MVNLLSVIAADGLIDKNEVDLLAHVGNKYGIDNQELLAIVESPVAVKILIPESQDQRLSHMQDILNMIVIDGDVSTEELKLLYMFSRAYGFSFGLVSSKLTELASQRSVTFDGKPLSQVNINSFGR